MYLTLLIALRAWGRTALPIPRGGKLSHHAHVDDVVSAIRTLLTAPTDRVRGRAFSVADDRPTTAEEVVRVFCEAYGMQIRPLPAWINSVGGAVFRWSPGILDGYIADLNRRLTNVWARLVDDCGLRPVLQPRFDRGWLDYLWADHVYDTTALKELGWTPQVPSFLHGMPDTIRWYQENKWVPTRAQVEDFRRRRDTIAKKEEP